MLTESFDLTNPEQQLQLCVPGPAATYRTGTSLSFLPTSSAAKTAETTNPLGTEPSELSPLRSTSYQAARTIQESEPERAEAIESRAPIQLNTSLIHPRPRNGDQTIHVSPRNSKHGKTEKYFCPYPACSRSQPGSGFYRKDHFDQHLRGPHRQDSVARLGTKSTAGSSAPPLTLTVTNEATTHESTLQSKKRSRGSGGEINQRTGANNNSYFEELAEERRLRLLAEQENQRLSHKLENYEGRMQKYEERLDKMMALMESYNVVKRRGFQLEDGNDN
ncbi:hypothetical protein BGW36DRAFT_67088 [Talaromyces proteolyticus]|uniref:Uncharacterized protein n=1 Tax=Talaromyces proteolyticus TaxID=1131652 RepID=A0AAD4KEK7_9EURO|nr:uncharacterized protein BGW36DRAFT_67088 [Talaromyces proteolyticus]KAH8690090.1 hypothetical protein BGW36DRAFT_67088 [Talaromyces proteolyticus]